MMSIRPRLFLPLSLLLSPACGAEAPPPEADGELVQALAISANYGFAAADFDGDGRADLSVKGADGVWRIDHSRNGFGAWDVELPAYGGLSAIPVPADYDGDRRIDLSVKDAGGTWYIDYARNGFGAWDAWYPGYGNATAIPVPADYDGDGRADLSVKDSGGTWHIDYARTGFGAWDVSFRGYGGTGAQPVPADYDGDGRADLSVKDSGGTWYIDYARTGFGAWDASFGGRGGDWAIPAPADYDGDRRADLSVKDSGGSWYIDRASPAYGPWDQILTARGGSAFRPIPADYDGDGRADLAVTDGRRWHLDLSSNGYGAWDQIYEVVGPVLLRVPQNGSNGAEGNPTGRPIGGGPGYGAWVPRPADGGVTTLDQLVRELDAHEAAVGAALASGAPIPERVVYVSDEADIDLYNTTLRLAPGLTLASGRGRTGSRGAFLHTEIDNYSAPVQMPSFFIIPRSHLGTTRPLPPVRVTGLVLQGPDPSERAPDCSSSGRKGISGVEQLQTERDDPRAIVDRVIEIDNVEMVAWPVAAIELAGIRGAYVHHNLIHFSLRSAHRAECLWKHAKGYGVVVNNGLFRIEANLFDNNRHSIASTGSRFTDYIATYNIVSRRSTSHNFDVHGGHDREDGTAIAGRRIVIAFNTFTDPDAQQAVEIRGVPVEGAWITHNRHRPSLFVQSKTEISCPTSPVNPDCRAYVSLNQSY